MEYFGLFGYLFIFVGNAYLGYWWNNAMPLLYWSSGHDIAELNYLVYSYLYMWFIWGRGPGGGCECTTFRYSYNTYNINSVYIVYIYFIKKITIVVTSFLFLLSLIIPNEKKDCLMSPHLLWTTRHSNIAYKLQILWAHCFLSVQQYTDSHGMMRP